MYTCLLGKCPRYLLVKTSTKQPTMPLYYLDKNNQDIDTEIHDKLKFKLYFYFLF